MPTPSEQKALAFVAIVVLLGGAVRVLRAGGTPRSTDSEQQAIARQATAAESAATTSHKAKGKRARMSHKRDTLPNIVGEVESVPSTSTRPRRLRAPTPFGAPLSPLGFPPPAPRIDSDFRALRPVLPQDTQGGASTRKATSGVLIDLDTASEATVEELPHVGPATAHRIVTNRDSLGPFRSLEGLSRVKGIRAATLRKLAPFVTFSGATAPGRSERRY